ncbi:MAG: 6-bladed beta-propeller [Tannerellaceae bacterium]|jgi:hypothetical protein|nr:6-bladed beta-propeller [Tannerellaceae bacterium]
MKRVNSILAIILSLAVVPESRGQRQAGNNDFIAVDVTRSYSKKKELILQDFMDVEYITLEANDDFVNQGHVLDIGKEIILVKNRVNDGNIFVYDRHGKALRKINRKGQGNEEYTYITNIILDEDKKEMFVSDHNLRKILVYDLYGKFKRSFRHREGSFKTKESSRESSLFYTDIFNYNRDNLICYDQYNEEITFVLVSKHDGSITRGIKVPFKEKKLLVQVTSDGSGTHIVGPGPHRSIIPFKGDWLLLEPSSDTVFTFLPDYSLRPFVARTPSIQSMDPGVFLILRLLSDRYYFMEAITNIWDWNAGAGFPKSYLIYDRQEKAFSGYTVYNGDFSTKKEIYMSVTTPVNHEIESWYPLEAYQLVESYNKGELKGRLKEVAAKLDEDSNPVIMLIRHKK